MRVLIILPSYDPLRGTSRFGFDRNDKSVFDMRQNRKSKKTYLVVDPSVKLSVILSLHEI